MWWKRVVVWAIAMAAALSAVRFGSAAVCARGAAEWQAGDRERQLALSRSVIAWTESELAARSYATGSQRFDGEWLFGTHVMAALGLSQIALAHPSDAGELQPAARRAIDGALSPAARAFDRAAWNEDPIESLNGGGDHAAYLGYLGVALGLERRLDPNGPHAKLHDRIAAALEERLERSPSLLLQTYPGEVYPVDNAAIVATLALHARATGRPRPPLIARWVDACRERFVDPETGLLFQALSPRGLVPSDHPRGSGTALAVYFLSFADPALSRELHLALERNLGDTVLGFGVVHEYPRGRFGFGDIDSGPLVFGYSISATGFSLAGCRMYGDSDCFRRRYATFHLFGAPHASGERASFVSGGPLGDAIVLAMLTALPPEEVRS